jgi:hypothetical protein
MRNVTELGRYYASLEGQIHDNFGCPLQKRERYGFVRDVVGSDTQSTNPSSYYIVRSSFTDIEHQFFNITFTQIASLAKGKDLADAQRVVPSLAQRIVQEYYQPENRDNPSFAGPVRKGLFNYSKILIQLIQCIDLLFNE